LGSDSSPNFKSPTLVNVLDENGSWLGKLEHWIESLVEYEYSNGEKNFLGRCEDNDL
jgi:hypothetical protein